MFGFSTLSRIINLLNNIYLFQQKRDQK